MRGKVVDFQNLVTFRDVLAIYIIGINKVWGFLPKNSTYKLAKHLLSV